MKFTSLAWLLVSLVAIGSQFSEASVFGNVKSGQPEEADDDVDEQSVPETVDQDVSEGLPVNGGPQGAASMAAFKNGQEPTKQVAVDAQNAKAAADTAQQAAQVANKVAEHSVKITGHAKSALKHALGALHAARVETDGLDADQRHSLGKAEAKLREATKNAEYGKLKKLEKTDAQKDQMQEDMGKVEKKSSELEQMRKEIRDLKEEVKRKGGDEDAEKDLDELEKELERLEKEGKIGENDQMKAEIERLREIIDKMKAKHPLPDQAQPKHPLPEKAEEKEEKELMKDVDMKPIGDVKKMDYEATPVEAKGIDIDTQLPYGDLEPFGREDTAQELTESSVKESDAMVDQLERAEVAEEKRAVFRALTRLRGAAITSFDGVARSQTGNIDQYNKVHKWRKSHPVHHLADEESDINKWAFPDNADFIQKNQTGHAVISK